jgi:hypothetical protein
MEKEKIVGKLGTMQLTEARSCKALIATSWEKS